MAKEALIAQLESMANALLDAAGSIFLVQIRIKPTNNVKVYLDGDQGVTVSDTIQLNRKLYAALEEAALFPDGDFSLEVSSAGVGEALLLRRQYVKNIGRWLAVKTTDDRELEGELTTVDEGHIVVQEVKGKGKKAETITHTIPFDLIKKAVVEVRF